MLKLICQKAGLLLSVILLGFCSTPDGVLTITFTGDVLLDRGVRQTIEKEGIDYLFEDATSLFQASDAVVINLECPLTDTFLPIHKKYIFIANPEWALSLYKNGITHAALANNHSIDQGREGLMNTARHLTEAGIVPLGCGKDQQTACRPVFISQKGIEVALFNSVLVPLENWVYLADEPGVCQATIESLSQEIRALKKEKVHCSIWVILHWGVEFQLQPTLRQRLDAYRLIEAGADGIIGHHPHVIQKEEVYKGKPIFYSLGNFIFDQNQPTTIQSIVVQLRLSRTEVSYMKQNFKIDAGKAVKGNNLK